MNDHAIGLAVAVLWRITPMIVWAIKHGPAFLDQFFWHEIDVG